MAEPTSKTLANGIHALVGGTGPTIVCVPGWPETAAAFLDMYPALSATHKVVILDPPGLGASAAPSEDDYTVNTIAALLIGAFKSEIGPTTPYHLVGHDVGAWLAFPMAAQDRAHIRTLTLMDAAISGLSTPPPFPLPDAMNIKLWQFSFNRLPGGLPETLVRGKERVLLDWLFDQKAVHPERITAERRETYVAAYTSDEGAMGRGFAYYRSAGESAAQTQQALQAGKLEVPVQCVAGRAGTGENMKIIPAALTAAVEKSRFVVLEDCGHYVMEEQPEECAAAVLDFAKSSEVLGLLY